MAFLEKVKEMVIGKTLYFPGCVTKFKLPEIQEKYEKLLQELNIKYVKLDNEFCCGLPALNKGYKEDFERLRHENLTLFQNRRIGRIITNCPACMYMFKEHYGLDAQHISELIDVEQHDEEKGEISYHDSCYLARHCNIINEPREILKKKGYKVKDNINQGKQTSCCGLGHTDIETKNSKKIAEHRLKDFSTKKIVTACPLCYKHLKESAEEKEVLELSEVIE